MDLLHLSDASGADISVADPALLQIDIAYGHIQSYPGALPSQVRGTFYVGGQGLTYDANDQLNGGTITSMRYAMYSPYINGSSIYFGQLNLPATQFYNWFLTDSTQLALQTILAGADRAFDLRNGQRGEPAEGLRRR